METANKRKRNRNRKKMIIRIIVASMLLILAALLTAAIPIYMEYTRTESSDTIVTVVIESGASEQEIAAELKKAGVINYELSFRLKMYNSPYRGKLNYGTFTLYKEMCLDDLIRTLAKPTMTEGIKLTVPEGFSAEMIAQRCEELGFCSAEEFLRVLREEEFNYEFIKEIPDNPGVKYKLQGYLFPSTHFFDADADAYQIIDALLGEFEKQYESVKSRKPENMSMNEVIVRASLIEREAKLDNERVIISGVIQNRIEIGMLLQIDACVVYAISDGLYNVDRVLYKDLEVDSPYNTYKYAGLPTGAICNPGILSIQAAMEPQKHNYLYYHTDTQKNDGSHIFSETFSNHKK